MNIKQKVESILKAKIKSSGYVGGGCINNAERIETTEGKIYFLKHNSSAAKDMFYKEANGLKELAKADVIKIPEVIEAADDFILLENIEQKKQVKNFYEDFGRKFALLHKFTNEEFGFYEDNYIGSTVQKNIPDDNEKNNWREFYWIKRIKFQIQLLEEKGHLTEELLKLTAKLEEKIDKIISSGNEHASLLHGDLWSGNYITDENGQACLIDPAVYYGNREADLAMTKLFGGFSSQFYNAYNEEFPLEDGYDYRENIYKLYHVLNHVNLFGSSYYGQAVNLIKYYL